MSDTNRFSWKYTLRSDTLKPKLTKAALQIKNSMLSRYIIIREQTDVWQYRVSCFKELCYPENINFLSYIELKIVNLVSAFVV